MAPPPPPGTDKPLYEERLGTPLWWYPVAIGIGAILAAEFRLADESLTVWIPFCVVLPLSAAVVWSMGRNRVSVAGGELRVRDAHLPLGVVTAVVPLDAATLRRLVGREGDPLAFISIRAWIGPGIQLQLADPDDPTPYWVVSTRHPDRLIAALRSSPVSH